MFFVVMTDKTNLTVVVNLESWRFTVSESSVQNAVGTYQLSVACVESVRRAISAFLSRANIETRAKKAKFGTVCYPGLVEWKTRVSCNSQTCGVPTLFSTHSSFIAVSVWLYKHLEWSDPRGRQGRDGTFGARFWSRVLHTTSFASLQHTRHHLYADQTPWRLFIRSVTADQELISHHNFYTLTNRQVMRIKKMFSRRSVLMSAF